MSCRTPTSELFAYVAISGVRSSDEAILFDLKRCFVPPINKRCWALKHSAMKRVSVLTVLLGVALCFGCGGGSTTPELADVTGIVLINGAPPSGPLRVIYEPQTTGSSGNTGTASEGMTDPGGMYELKYRGEISGAVPGSHVVKVYPVSGGGPAGGEMAVAQDMVIPSSYNDQSNITRTVEKGKKNEHTIEIELKKK